MKRKRRSCICVLRKGLWWDGKRWGTYEELNALRVADGKNPEGYFTNMRCFHTLQRAIRAYNGIEQNAHIIVAYYSCGIYGKGWRTKWEAEK